MTNKKRTCGMDDYCDHCQSKAKMHPMERNGIPFPQFSEVIEP